MVNKKQYISGEETLEDDEERSTIEIQLPQLPLSNTEETVSVVLDEPYGAPGKLGNKRSCIVTIRHDKGSLKVILFYYLTQTLLKSIVDVTYDFLNCYTMKVLI